MSSTTLFSTLVLLSLVALSYQLKCYHCIDGTSDPKALNKAPVITPNITYSLLACGEFPDSLLQECPAGYDSCFRAGGEIDSEVGTADGHIHGCVNTDAATICTGAIGKSMKLTCAVCSEDACNSAGSQAISLILLSTSLMVFKLIF